MNALPQLFKKDSKGVWRCWEVEVDTFDRDAYRTHAGMVGGKIVTSEWTIVEAKNVGRTNETSLADQAHSEAQSAWQKKVDSGYLVHMDESAVSAFVKPMLAKNFEDYAGKVTFPCHVQPKLDGMRAIVTRHGMTSRNGKPIVSAPHILEALKRVFEVRPDAVFDGELYAHKYSDNFNAIISLAKKVKPTAADLAESKEHLQYHVYDMVDAGSPFVLRYDTLVALLDDYLPDDDETVFEVPTRHVHDLGEADEFYAIWMDNGYEGQMVRWTERGYENKRSDQLLKRKEFKDEEFEIVDIGEGIGNKSGMAGFAVLRLPDGRTFCANVTGGNEYARRLLAHRADAIGKMGTVKFFNYTPDGMPRFPHLKGIRDYE